MEPLSANDPRMIGEFRLHARLGAGGMGQVYLGFSPAGRPVAIKVVHAQFARDQEFLQRFSREVAAARAVSGMYTAPVVGSGLEDDPPWLATAFVPGPPLAAVVARNGPLPEAAIWRLAAGLAEALHAVHAAGLVHRDLKPANVLLADDGPHVIDFGISRAFQGTVLTSAGLTSAGMVIGTPGYMSPEQAQSDVAGPPSDIFSLGCVLCYAATGKAPFGDGTAASVLFRVVTAEPRMDAVAPALRPVIEACLKKDPAQRPGPGQLIAMISAFGPGTAATLGSFWPGDVARVIAAEQARQTPAGLTPPAPPAPPGASAAAEPVAAAFPGTSGTSGTGIGHPPAGPASAGPAGMNGPDSQAAQAQAQRHPTALATPPPAPPSASPSAPLPGPLAGPFSAPEQGSGFTGHAPMLSDGYYAAAQARTPAPASPAIPPVSPVPQPYPQQPGYQQPSYRPPGSGHGSGGQQPPFGPVPPVQVPPGPGAYGAYAPPGAGTPPGLYGPQPPAGGTAWPPAGAPGGAGALGQYAAGRRKPASAEVPEIVHSAIKVMYAGFAVTLVDLVLSIGAYGRYNNQVTAATAAGLTRVAGNANSMSGATAVGMLADLLGLVCWICLAVACRRGRGWTRVAGAVLLGVYSICALFVLFGTHRDPGPQLTTIGVWALGVAATVLLWSRPASAFFLAWRRR